MKGVYISDDDKLYIHKNIIKKLGTSLFFCRDKEDIQKIKDSPDVDGTFSFINIIKLNSMKLFFDKSHNKDCSLEHDHLMV